MPVSSDLIWWLRNFKQVNKVDHLTDTTCSLTYWSQSVNCLVLHWGIIFTVAREDIQDLRSSLIRSVINLHDYIISTEQISIPREEPLWCFQSYWPRSCRLRNGLSLTKINEKELFPLLVLQAKPEHRGTIWGLSWLISTCSVSDYSLSCVHDECIIVFIRRRKHFSGLLFTTAMLFAIWFSNLHKSRSIYFKKNDCEK